MPRQLRSTAAPIAPIALLALACHLGACASDRLSSPRPRPQAALEPLAPAPTARVTAEPLAPPPGAQGAPAEPPLGTDIVAAPPAIAEAAPPPVAPPVVATGRSSVVGGWTASDASGTCRVSLSSTPSLDLYKASAPGCSNKDLAKVSAWDFRDGEVYLYQPGGTVAARLRQAGGTLDGAFSKSGASLTMTR